MKEKVIDLNKMSDPCFWGAHEMCEIPNICPCPCHGGVEEVFHG